MSKVSQLKSESSKRLKKLRLSFASQIDVDIVDGMDHAADLGRKRLEEEMAIEATKIEHDESMLQEDKYWYLESLSDRLYIYEKTTELISEMQIIALFKMIEVSLKEMCKISEQFTEKQLNSLYRHSELKKLLSAKICDIELLQGYSEFNELRCINNCLKHSGKVDAELARFRGWKEKESLRNVGTHYERLKHDCTRFVTEVRNQILAKVV